MASAQQQIDELNTALELLRAELPGAIAAGIRAADDKPPAEKGSATLQFGRIMGVFADQGYCTVILDGELDPQPVSMLGGLIEGERCAVLFYPPSGSLALGMIDPTGVVGGGGTGEILQATVALPDPDVDSTPASGIASWSHLSGATLVDLSDPTHPAFPVDGIYSVGFGATLPPPADPGTAFFAELSTTAIFSQPDLPHLGGFSIVISGFATVDDPSIEAEIEAIFSGGGFQTVVYTFAAGDSFSDAYIAALKASETATGGATLSLKCVVAQLT